MASEVIPFYKNSAHGIFHQVLMIVTTVDVILHLYCTYLIVRVSTPPMRQYRRFMLFSAVRWFIPYALDAAQSLILVKVVQANENGHSHRKQMSHQTCNG